MILLVAKAQMWRNGLVIDTSLRSLAPQISQDSLSETLIDQLSATASRKATVVLAADARDPVEAASDQLRARLAELEGAGYTVKLADPAETAAHYVRVLEEYPYNFLRPSLATLLADADAARANFGLEGPYLVGTLHRPGNIMAPQTAPSFEALESHCASVLSAGISRLSPAAARTAAWIACLPY